MTDTEFTLEAICMLESQQCWRHYDGPGQIARNFTSIVEGNPRLHGHWCTLSSTTKRILALEVALDLSIYF